jgi:hypothetical protein
MELADRAIDVRRQNRGGEAQSLYRQACELESQAAMTLADHLEDEPTRSVLFRSAATLAFQGALPAYAAYLAARGLEGTPPTEIRDELRDLLRSIQPEGMFDSPDSLGRLDRERWERFLTAEHEIRMAFDDLQRSLAESRLKAGKLSVSLLQRILPAIRVGLRKYAPDVDFYLDIFGLNGGGAGAWASVVRVEEDHPDDWDQLVKFVFHDQGESILEHGNFFAGSTKELADQGVVSAETKQFLLERGALGIAAWPIVTLARKGVRRPGIVLIGLTSDPTIFRDDLTRRVLRHGVLMLELAIVIGQRDEMLTASTGQQFECP